MQFPYDMEKVFQSFFIDRTESVESKIACKGKEIFFKVQILFYPPNPLFPKEGVAPRAGGG